MRAVFMKFFNIQLRGFSSTGSASLNPGKKLDLDFRFLVDDSYN